METDYKKYDSASKYECCGVRLAKDAEVRETANGRMVRLTFVDSSRRAGDNGIEDMWVEANVNDFQSDAAAHMKKGDVLHKVDGKPYLRKWGENESKVSFCLERAQLVIPLDLFAPLKERGFVPGAKTSAAAKKPAAKKPATRAPIALPDDDLPY